MKSAPGVMRTLRCAGLALCLVSICGAMDGCDDDDDDSTEHCVGLTAAELAKGLAPFCDDLTTVAEGKYPEVHAEFMKYVEGLVPDTAGDKARAMRPVVGERPASGSVFAYKGAKQLTEKDLDKRGMVVARINTSTAYAHGLQSYVSYVFVERRGEKGYRVLLVPQRSNLPVSVLYASKFTHRETRPGGGGTQPSGSRMMATVHFESDFKAWYESMTGQAQGCVDNQRTACLVNAIDIIWQPKSKKPFAGDEDGPTDFWVWVTETGCVCVGTGCHDS